MQELYIDGRALDAKEIYLAARNQHPVRISDAVRKKVAENRSYLDKKMEDPSTVIYGINTGFGSLCNIRISDANLKQLQENLVLSHACGMGELVPDSVSRAIQVLKIVNLSHGCSGIRPLLLDQMSLLYNHGLYPVIHQLGSLGASGDLAPLAHLSLPLLGKGFVRSEGLVQPAESALKNKGLQAISLQSKEGLALLNGTQFSLAYACFLVTEGLALLHLSNTLAAMSMEAYNCDIAPFDSLIHLARPHSGQVQVAAEVCAILSGSGIRDMERSSVQDPYSFRCVPQVHGASMAAIQHALDIVNTEINSVTDNPLVFSDADLVLSGGNFHAQPLALVLDYLCIALAELGNISERRVYQLINGDRGLPSYLTKEAGLNSGFMIAQYTAASIVSQNKQYCSPASVDSIVSSKGQEDHVSMASNAATKAFRVMENLKMLLAIEWLTAAQAMEFRRTARTSPQLEAMIERLRAVVKPLEADRFMHADLQATQLLVQSWLEETIC